MKLRWYQEKLIEKTFEALKKHSKICIVAPCGSGKTLVSSQIAKTCSSQGKSVLFLVDMDVLVGQTSEKFSKLGVSHGFIKAGYEENRSSKVQIASVQTLPKREWWKNHYFDVIIIDEAHITAFYKFVRKELMEDLYPASKYIGLTATPYRMGKDKMCDIFEKLVWEVTPQQLQDEGFLSPIAYWSIGEPDLKGIKTYQGDYQEKELKVRCDKEELIKYFIGEWLRRCYGKRTLVFCIDVDHAENVCKIFRSHDIPSVVVSAKTPREQRKVYYEALREGRLQVVCSVDALSKGFDEPSVEAGLMLRPTRSRAIFEQQVGRIGRISPETGKVEGTILDGAGNVKRHGFIEDVKSYRLDYRDDDDEAKPTPLKDCPECGALMYGFVMTCPNCGHEFVVEQNENDKPVKLIRVFSDSKERKKFEHYRELIKEAFEKGYKPGYAKELYRRSYHFYPKQDWGLGAIYGDEPTKENFLEYWLKLAEVSKSVASAKGAMTIEFTKRWEKVLANDLQYQFSLEQLRRKDLAEVKKTNSKLWEDILKNFQKRSTRALFEQQCQILDWNGGDIVIGTKSKQLRKMIESKIGEFREAYFKSIESVDESYEISLKVIS